jgi:hypothetical protein
VRRQQLGDKVGGDGLKVPRGGGVGRDGVGLGRCASDLRPCGAEGASRARRPRRRWLINRCGCLDPFPEFVASRLDTWLVTWLDTWLVIWLVIWLVTWLDTWLDTCLDTGLDSWLVTWLDTWLDTPSLNSKIVSG